MSSINGKLGFIAEADTTIRRGNSDSLVYHGWMDESIQRPYLHLLNYLGSGSVLPKLTAKNYLGWQQMHMERLLELYDLHGDDSALPRMAHKWLGQNDAYSPNRWLGYDRKLNAKATLMDMLAAQINTNFTKGEFQDFAREVLKLVNCIQVFPHDTDDKINRKADTVNERFRCLNIPYEFHQTGQGKTATYTLAPITEVC